MRMKITAKAEAATCWGQKETIFSDESTEKINPKMQHPCGERHLLAVIDCAPEELPVLLPQVIAQVEQQRETREKQ